MKVTNLTSPRSGGKVANQFEIKVGEVYAFQSYDTLIAIKQGRHYTISEDYNYSNTTSKYFSQWLRDWGWRDDEIKNLKKWLAKHKTGDVSTEEFSGIGGGLVIQYASSNDISVDTVKL